MEAEARKSAADAASKTKLQKRLAKANEVLSLFHLDGKRIFFVKQQLSSVPLNRFFVFRLMFVGLSAIVSKSSSKIKRGISHVKKNAKRRQQKQLEQRAAAKTGARESDTRKPA